MSGDPSNAAVWANADVFIGPIDATIPSGGDPFGDEWDHVGLLNGADGFDEKINVDSSDHYAWGGILVASTRKNFKLTRSFTAYEDNPTMYDLWYPGHSVVFADDGSFEGDVNVPDLQHSFKIAFQVRTGSKIKRVVCKNYAQLEDRGDSKEGEDDLASRQATVVIYPDASGGLFHTYKGPQVAVTSISATPATVTLAVAATSQIAVAATMADSHVITIDKPDAVYSSSDKTKATVSATGRIKAVATGSAVITVTYGGSSDTIAVTVS